MKEFLRTFLTLHVIFYFIFSFIAWDLNPLHWMLFQGTVGRMTLVSFELLLFTITKSIECD